MFMILTSKPGQFRTEINTDLRPLDADDYLFYGTKKAEFVIAELLTTQTKIRVVEEGSSIVNDVPSKFFPKFDTPEKAFEELKHLTTFGHMDTALRRCIVKSTAHGH